MVRIKLIYYKVKYLIDFILQYHIQYRLMYYIIALYCKIKSIKYLSFIGL